MATMAERYLPMPELNQHQIDLFWASVIKRGEDDCWIWYGATFASRTYGRFTYKRKSYVATRIAYYLEYGDDPSPLMVCHECNNPSCVNPRHLFLGDQSANQLQAYHDGRHNKNGSLNPCAKLTENEVTEIKKLLSTHSSPQLANKFHVSKSTIYHISVGDTWRHVK